MLTFHTNCTVPSGDFDYVTSPNTRGTLQILWSCLTTLILCTWTVQHLNVPEQSNPQTLVHRIVRRLKRFGTKLWWMLLTLFAPEYILGKAYSDFRSARSHLAEFTQQAAQDGVEWSVTHSFLANMGGFAIYFDSSVKERAFGRSDTALPTDNHAARAEILSPQHVGNDHSRRDNGTRRTTHSADVISATSAREPSVDANPVHHQQQELETVASHTQPNASPIAVLTSPPDQTESVAEGTSNNDDRRGRHDESNQRSRPSITHALSQDFGMEQVDHFQRHKCRVKPEQASMMGRLIQLDPSTTSVSTILDRIRNYQVTHIQNRTEAEIAHQDGVDAHVWAQDATNISLVNMAIDELQLDVFPTTWEKTRFTFVYRSWCANLRALQGNIWTLDACQLLLARKLGIIDKLPSLSEDEVDDRNKGDFLVKGIAVGQVVWLFIQLVARGVKGLVPSQLEIVVLAFAACTFVTYILLWSKPQDVKTPTYIRAHRSPSASELSRLAIYGPATFSRYRRHHWIPNNASHCDGSNGPAPHRKIATGSVLGAMMFGGLHCAAWNFHFPHPAERLLWRIAAVITVGIPPVAVGLNIAIRFLFRRRTKPYPELMSVAINWLMVSCSATYALARLSILVEAFLSLGRLDPDTYRTTWSTNLPHGS